MTDETPEQLQFHNRHKTSKHTPKPALRSLKSCFSDYEGVMSGSYNVHVGLTFRD